MECPWPSMYSTLACKWGDCHDAVNGSCSRHCGSPAAAISTSFSVSIGLDSAANRLRARGLGPRHARESPPRYVLSHPSRCFVGFGHRPSIGRYVQRRTSELPVERWSSGWLRIRSRSRTRQESQRRVDDCPDFAKDGISIAASDRGTQWPRKRLSIWTTWTTRKAQLMGDSGDGESGIPQDEQGTTNGTGDMDDR